MYTRRSEFSDRSLFERARAPVASTHAWALTRDAETACIELGPHGGARLAVRCTLIYHYYRRFAFELVWHTLLQQPSCPP